MSRFEASVRQVDFGREIEIGVTDTENPSRHMVIRVPEIHVDDVAEMLQALLDQLNLHRKGEDPKDITAPSFDRLVAAFEDEVKTSRGDDG